MQKPNDDDNSPAHRISPRDRAVRGWSWWLAAGVSAAITFLSLSGLWLFLGPFSVFSQLLVLGHTVLGLAVLVLFGWYLARHLSDWWRQQATAEMILGYALLAAVVAGLVSGVVNTATAALGSGVPPIWDLLHLISGLTVPALLLAHLLLAYRRRRPAASRDAELRSSLRSFPKRLTWTVAATLVPIGLAAFFWPRGDFRQPVPEDYSLPTYAQEFDEYRGNPFAPTYARTEDMELVTPDLLANSASCGSSGCHAEILAEWEPSAHRFAAMNPPFQAVQRLFAEERDSAETRYCAGCHDPISLFAGAKDLSQPDLSAPGVDEGISCVACHAISKVDQRGNADYILTPPAKYLGELGSGWPKAVGDFLIRAYPRQHLADYDRNVLRTAEFCGACHKQFIPEALNRFGLVSGQNQYDEWKNSHWHSEDPATDLSCRDCHMRLVDDSRDPGRGEAGDRRRGEEDEAHRHHGFIATNNFMPALLKLPHWEEQVRLTEEWVRGETVLPEIAHLWPEGPVVGLQILTPEEIAAGRPLELRVMITNRKAGHNFITGPLDFIRSWVHLRVTDGSGQLLAEWGAVDPETRRILDQNDHAGESSGEGETLILQSMPVDEHGEVLERHELWKKAGGQGTRVLFPSYTDSQRYRFEVPDDVEGPLQVVAHLNYRRYRQRFLDLVLPGLEEEAGVFQPTVTQAEASRIVPLAGDTAAPAAGGG